MLIVADVHGEAAALRKVAAVGEPLLVLGDLINMIDYRTNEGIVRDITGGDFVDAYVSARAAGRWATAQQMWRDFRQAHGADELHRRFNEEVEAQYLAVCAALTGTEAYVTYGNVDRPELMKRMLPRGAKFVDGEVIEIEGWTVGFAGGGLMSLNTPGEVDDETMATKLEAMAGVDVLCTHVAPSVPELAGDVISGRDKGSNVVKAHIETHQPELHFFGDIHQPKATTWRIGNTISSNVGYFRATGRGLRLAPRSVPQRSGSATPVS